MYPFYLGIDLHNTNTYAVLIDKAGVVIDERQFSNNETSKYRRETPNYPSLTSPSSGGSGTYKETQKYTGDLIVGIATMHKSNAVPVMKGTSQAEDIAKMRRG